MEKPHRFLLDRVASYAEEGSAFLRRRRIRSQPFARVWREGGAVAAIDLDTDVGERIIAAADQLIAADAVTR
ncbi:MAG: hypothetical protein H0V25_05030 [Solirubrobacterales bacterium]|nr:hypothetical protein [Solirubrobacterales bacterium]